MAGPHLFLKWGCRARVPLSLHGCPGGAIDNAQMLDRFLDLLRRISDPGNTLSRVGVLLHADAAVDDATIIGRVAEDPVLATARADDRAGAPFGAARCRDTFAVERMGDCLGAFAREVRGEDAADHCGFDDPAMAALERAVGQQNRGGFIAVAQTTGHEPARYRTLRAASDLVAQLFDEECVHRAEQPDMKLADFPLTDCPQLDAGELQPFEYGRGVGLVAGDAIQRLGDYNFEGPGISPREQGVEAGALVGGAGDCEVGVNLRHIVTVPVSEVATDAGLILGRAGALQIG
ncbi:MAG TPA: hypothetical protein VGN66_17005 [Sphingomonas sp.]|nr:hypothetical protein [Sphingomonas sp.]